MRFAIVGLLPLIAAAQTCYELRGKTDAASIEAVSQMLEDPDNFTCAATNLRIAGAVEPLKHGLAGKDPQVRAAAARELGAFQKPELLEALSRAAADENVLVAANALAGLSRYEGREVVPYLSALAGSGGMVGDMALDRLEQLDSAEALRVARGLLVSSQVPDKLYAMRAIGNAGDASDLPALRKIAASSQENLAQRSRGFGFMPPINLARAAEAAIQAIEARK